MYPLSHNYMEGRLCYIITKSLLHYCIAFYHILILFWPWFYYHSKLLSCWSKINITFDHWVCVTLITTLLQGSSRLPSRSVMLRSHEGQNVWRWTGDENYVFWWRWVPIANVWSHEKTHSRCIDKPLGNLRGSITDAAPNIRRCIGEYPGINRCYIG